MLSNNIIFKLQLYSLQANEEEKVTPDALGAKGKHFLIVKNMSATEKAAVTIEIV